MLPADEAMSRPMRLASVSYVSGQRTATFKEIRHEIRLSEKDGKRRRLYTDMRIEEKAVEELEELSERGLTTEIEEVVLAVTARAAPDPYYHAIERMGDKEVCIAHLRQEGREVKRLLVTEDFDGFYNAVKRFFLNFT